MADDYPPSFSDSDDLTIPSAARLKANPPEEINDATIASAHAVEQLVPHPPASAPWLLQQYFGDQRALAAELNSRFPMLPLMTVIRLNPRGDHRRQGSAALSTADGSASIVVDVDGSASVTQFSFTLSSMFGLSFRLDHLTDMDRISWLRRMRHEREGVSFLWGQARWESDYLICLTRKHFAHIYAFSPHGTAAAARLTPDIRVQLLDWLENVWRGDEPGDDTTQQLLTW
jgi:hypothetical protein